ncbi:hypothetical protein Tco_1303384 [Tanacetum coccineum]
MKAGGVKGDHLHLLKDVSGAYTPGILTSLAGVSRAGKITLMDVIADVNTGSHKMFVDELVELMELNHTRDALVGLPAMLQRVTPSSRSSRSGDHRRDSTEWREGRVVLRRYSDDRDYRDRSKPLPRHGRDYRH